MTLINSNVSKFNWSGRKKKKTAIENHVFVFKKSYKKYIYKTFFILKTMKLLSLRSVLD